MRGYMACGPWEQGPGCGPFGPYGRFGCQERGPGAMRFEPPGVFVGRPGCCRDDSGPESGGRRRGNCQEDSGPGGSRRQGHHGCSCRRGRGCESSDEEGHESDRRDGSHGRRRGCRHHHRGPFGHGGPFGHLGPFGHRGPFGSLGPYRGHFGPDRFERHGFWGHGHGPIGSFGVHFGRHGGQRGSFGADDCDFGRGHCSCDQNEGCMRGRTGGCSKNKDQNKDGEAECAGRKKNKPSGPQDKDQSGTVLVQRIVVETPRSYSV